MFSRSTFARRLLDRVKAATGLPLQDICLRGPGELLRRPDVLEPALLILSLAHAEELRQQGTQPAVVAGYSAGELAALCVAGVLSVESALEAAVRRGRILGENLPPGKMVALYGVPTALIHTVVRSLAVEGVISIGAWNAPDHVTLCGEESLLRRAVRAARTLGAQCGEIDVAGPWHCALAAPAAQRVARALVDLEFRPPKTPVYLGSLGGLEDAPERLRAALADQIQAPVLWQQITDGLLRAGVEQFTEVGPGRVLCGLVRRRVGGARSHHISWVERPPIM